jgi:hypothetical protein
MMLRVLACVFVLSACSGRAPTRAQPSPAPHRVTFEPDDVAILAPGGDPLAASDVLPAAIYERAFGVPGTLQLGGTPAAPSLAALRLVAVRIDPQHEQLRFVLQPLGEHDDAVHLVFALDRGEARALAEAVAALRGSADLGPLGPHPLLVRQGSHGAFGTALAALLRQHAQSRKLARITVFTSSGLGTAWNFFGVDVTADGTTMPLAIPTLPAGTHLEAFFAGFVEDELTADMPFTPAATMLAPRDDLRVLASRQRRARATAAERDLAIAAVARIEDPDIHTSDTIDCASCHVAHLVQTPGTRDVHMFGYAHGHVSIQPRTLREVAATVAALNGD